MNNFKFATLEELPQFFGSTPWEQKFWLKSPLEKLSDPRDSMFIVGSGCQSYMNFTNSYFIGLEYARVDFRDYPNIWNFYRYEIYNHPTPIGTFLIQGPIKNIPYHRTSSIPKSIYTSLPDQIKLQVDIVQNKNIIISS